MSRVAGRHLKEAVIEPPGHFVAEQRPQALLDELPTLFAERWQR